tara:strand:- start:5973 stop:6992 length:1020 start_codon:yes stop_codon:yes gene_type:complete
MVTAEKSGQKRKGRGQAIPPQGEGGYDQCWYVVARSSEVQPGEVIRRDFLDGHVSVWRGTSGRVVVTGPYCRHLGADLCVRGEVIGDELRCPFHHWKFAQDGQLTEVPSFIEELPSDGTLPTDADLFVYPTVEKLGLVWAFNGEEPLYETPAWPVDESELSLQICAETFEMGLDPALQFTNSFDYQHLKPIHGITVERLPEVEFRQYGVKSTGVQLKDSNRLDGANLSVVNEIFGTSALSVYGNAAGADVYTMLGMTPMPGGVAHGWLVTGGPKGTDEATLEMLEGWVRALVIDDDQDVMGAISFRLDNLAKVDFKPLGRFLKYAMDYPRAHPGQDFIS